MATKLMEAKLSAVAPSTKLDTQAVYLVGPEQPGVIRKCIELPPEACVGLSHIPEAAPICDMMGCVVIPKA